MSFLRQPFFWLLGVGLLLTLQPVKPIATKAIAQNALAGFGQLPLRFEAHPQPGATRFSARGLHYALSLQPQQALLQLPAAVVQMRWLGANEQPRLVGTDELATRSHYFIGTSKDWRTNVRNYGKVEYSQLYPGIDLVWYGNQQQLEYDFRIAPHAQPKQIQLSLRGADCLLLEPSGDLAIYAAGQILRMRQPRAWQTINGQEHNVECRFQFDARQILSFHLGAYDRAQPLVIDPLLLYSAMYDTNGADRALGVAVDREGNAYVTGETAAADFANTASAQPVYGGSLDAFVLKLNRRGDSVLFATYLGGNNIDCGRSIAVDASGNTYVTGQTRSPNFPTTTEALQTQLRGETDAFITKLSADGQRLLYSSYFGGNGNDLGNGIALDASGNAVIAGATESIDLFAGRASVPGLYRTKSGLPLAQTTDRALSWVARAQGLNVSAVTAFAFHPQNAQQALAATPNGVYRTLDDGANWQALTPSSAANALPGKIEALVFHPTDFSQVYAAGAAGIFKSTDGGQNWTAKNTAPPGAPNPAQGVNSLLIHPTTPLVIYAAANGGHFKSTNGGESWTFVYSNWSFNGSVPSYRALYFDAANRDILYAATTLGVLRSTNAGTDWQHISGGTEDARGFPIACTALAFDPRNPGTIYAAGRSAFSLYKTTNGGTSWQALGQGGLPIAGGATFFSIAQLLLDPNAPDTLYAGYFGQGVYRSTDGGATWQARNEGLPSRNLTALAFDPRNTARVWAAADTLTEGFAAKFNAAGTALQWLNYLGGSQGDSANAIALDRDGEVYVTGETYSPNFPGFPANQTLGNDDAFLIKLASNGTALRYARAFGGGGNDRANGIAVNANQQAVIAGNTNSTNLPVTQPYQATASGNGDAFVARFSADGTAVNFATYLGGSQLDEARAVALDANGEIVIAGRTVSPNFPALDAVALVPAAARTHNAFVTRLTAAGNALVYSTQLGGRELDEANGVAVDAAGNVIAVGGTGSFDFPPPDVERRRTFGFYDLFAVKLGTEAEITLTKTADRPVAQRGATLTYTLAVANRGPSNATAVTLTDPLPTGVSFASATASQGSCTHNANTVTCNLGSLNPNRSATVALTVTLSNTLAANPTLTNTAQVTAAEPDLIQTDNRASVAIRVATLPGIAGRITDAQGNGLADVTVTLSGSMTGTRTTDAQGFYQFADLASGGNYTVTPTRAAGSNEYAARSFTNLTADQMANFTVTPCTYALSPVSQNIGASGGSGTFNVIAPPRCPWRATSQSPWLTVTGNAQGSGNATVSFSVTAATAPRAGRIAVADQTAVIFQTASTCQAPRFRSASQIGFSIPTLVTDLNGDGLSEVVINRRDIGTIGRALAAVLTYDEASGGLRVLSELQDLHEAFNPITGDFNGDGKPDLAWQRFREVLLYFNDGQGKFSAPTRYSIGGSGYQVFAADLNRDGRDDLLRSGDGNDPAMILLSQSGGGYAASLGLRVQNVIALADFTGDGWPDLLTQNFATVPNGLLIYPGDGAGSFRPPLPQTDFQIARPVNIRPAVVNDFNADGKPDVLIPFFNQQPSRYELHTWLGLGNGKFAAPIIQFPVFEDTNFLALATTGDLNGDARPDLLYASNKMFFLAGDGTGRWGTPTPLDKLPVNQTVGLGRVNRDATTDLLMYSEINSSGYTQLWLNGCGITGPVLSGRVLEEVLHGGYPRELGGTPNVTVRLSGGQTATRVTDLTGYYEFANLPRANYQLEPVITPNVSYAPARASFTDLNAEQTQNFLITRVATAVSAASYANQAIAPDSIAALFGVNLSNVTEAARTTPLPQQIGATSVTINTSNSVTLPVGLFFASPGQVNLHIPPNLTLGDAQLHLVNDTKYPRAVTQTNLRLERVAPGLFTFNATGRGLPAAVALRVRADGSQVYESIARFDSASNAFVAIPLDLSNANEQVFLILFGTGFRNRLSLNDVNVMLGNQTLPALFAGAQGDLVGLDQLNLRLPVGLRGSGNLNLTLNVEGKSSNTVTIHIR